MQKVVTGPGWLSSAKRCSRLLLECPGIVIKLSLSPLVRLIKVQIRSREANKKVGTYRGTSQSIEGLLCPRCIDIYCLFSLCFLIRPKSWPEVFGWVNERAAAEVNHRSKCIYGMKCMRWKDQMKILFTIPSTLDTFAFMTVFVGALVPLGYLVTWEKRTLTCYVTCKQQVKVMPQLQFFDWLSYSCRPNIYCTLPDIWILHLNCE